MPIRIIKDGVVGEKSEGSYLSGGGDSVEGR
jgi:hypothetical protein